LHKTKLCRQRTSGQNQNNRLKEKTTMRTSSIASFVAILGLVAASSQVFAGAKVAEFGDPQIGNSYRNCTWTPTYSTGGFGYEYWQYNVSCPASNGIPAISITASVSITKSSSTETCTFSVPAGYNTSYNSCRNWRIYLN
jgi:hypothetical protein